MVRFASAFLAASLVSSPLAASPDDCESHFLVYAGRGAYQFNPALEGDAGRVRLFGLLSYQRAAAAGDLGRMFWKLEIRDSTGSLARRVHGSGRLDERGVVLGEYFWDGRDDRGSLVRPGRFTATFVSRYLPDRVHAGRALRAYGDLERLAGAEEAQSASLDVLVDYTLDAVRSKDLRTSVQLTSCQVQQNAPLEVGFPYDFYYGSTHSHSNFSDGGQATGSCSSGSSYGSGTFGPAQVYDYARNQAGLDFWVVNEHNHLINDSVATNDAPVTEAKVRQRYQDGRAAATAASVDGTFVAIYGMEWGVTSNGDQGHVTLLETPVLFGWETCSSCNGASAECTPGTNCYFDVYTPKRFGYLTMYQRSVENPSPAGALGIFCHPGSGEFDNWAFNANADQAMQGIAVRSGLAFSTANDCADVNVASSDYTVRWKAALDKGFHLAPTADHDSHCNTYGVALPTRTVYLLPNGSAPALTKAALLQAHKARHFYATEDPNLQLVFGTNDASHVMGDIFTVATTPTLRGAVHDPDGDAVSTLELWRGQIGAGVPGAPLASFPAMSSFTFTDTVTSGTYYYYVHVTQADGHDAWSAPMWITYDLAGCTPPASPVAANDGPECLGGTVNLTATTVPGATYSWTGPGGFTSSDQNPVLSNIQANQAGTYSVVAIVAACPSAPANTTVVVRTTTTTITAPASLCPSSMAVVFVPDAGPGATYAWNVTNGTLVSGDGTRFLTFGTGTSGTTALSVTVGFPEGCSATGNTNVTVNASCSTPNLFFPLTPCRLFDTRNPDGPFGGPVMAANASRTFDVVGNCGVPLEARAVSGNLTVTQPVAAGEFNIYAGDALAPGTSALSFRAGATKANNAFVRLATDGTGTATLRNVSAGTAHGILDVNGYFGPNTGPSTNQLLIRINEVDADQTGTDSAEFVELIAPSSTSLNDILVVFHSGSGGFAAAGYRAQNLDGQAFPATPLAGGTRSFFVLGPTTLAGFTSQPFNTLYTTGWPATNAVQNGDSNEADGLLVAFDVNDNGTYDNGTDLVIDKFAYVGSGNGLDGGTATNAAFKVIYGSTGSTYLGIDNTTQAMGKNTNLLPAATGSAFNYTTNNVKTLAPTPGALNAGQTAAVGN